MAFVSLSLVALSNHYANSFNKFNKYLWHINFEKDCIGLRATLKKMMNKYGPCLTWPYVLMGIRKKTSQYIRIRPTLLQKYKVLLEFERDHF